MVPSVPIATGGGRYFPSVQRAGTGYSKAGTFGRLEVLEWVRGPGGGQLRCMPAG